MLPAMPHAQHHYCHGPLRAVMHIITSIVIIATSANVWRSTGHPKKIKTAATRLWNPTVVSDFFTKIPGRVLRGRWGSIDAIEKIMSSAWRYISDTFKVAFPDASEERGDDAPRKRIRRTKKTSAQEEDEEDQTQVRNYRKTAVRATANPAFVAMVMISKVAKSPVLHFMSSMEKCIKKFNEDELEAHNNGMAYLGPTPLSGFVCEKAEKSPSRDLESAS